MHYIGVIRSTITSGRFTFGHEIIVLCSHLGALIVSTLAMVVNQCCNGLSSNNSMPSQAKSQAWEIAKRSPQGHFQDTAEPKQDIANAMQRHIEFILEVTCHAVEAAEVGSCRLLLFVLNTS